MKKLRAKRFFTNPYGVAGSAALCAALWGSAFPVIKKSYEALDIRPGETGELLWFAGLRFLLAGLMILGVMAAARGKIGLRRSALPGLLKIGVFQTFLQYVLFYVGMSLSTGMQGAVISGTTSFFQMLFGALGLLGAGFAAAGGAPRLDFSPAAAGMLAYLAFLSAAGFVLWNTIMKYNRVGNVSMYLFLIPVFGVLLSGLLLGEALHRFIALGLALVAAGIVIVNRRKTKEAQPAKAKAEAAG